MRRSYKVILSAVLVVVGLLGLIWALRFLLGEGLDRAEKWISIGGVFLSTAMSAGGLILGWMTWRQARAGTRSVQTVTVPGHGAVGIGGNNSGGVDTNVSGADASASPRSSGGAGVRAGGTGSVAVGGDNTASINTRVTGPDDRRQS